MPRVPALALAVAAWTAALRAPSVRADDGLRTQLDISSMIPGQHASSSTAKHNNWAVLPELGYTPDQQLNGGAKFTGRKLTDSEITIDAELNAAMRHQVGIDGSLLVPRFGGGGILSGEYHYYLSPDKYFFGLGNNHERSALSVHSIERQRGLMTLSYHLTDELVIAGTGGVRVTRFARSPRAGDLAPATQDVFPNLVGFAGGYTNPVIASLIYNDRASVTHPTVGWSAIGAIEYVNKNLGNDYRFTRYSLDASYLHPLPDSNHVFGLHVNGQYIDGRNSQIPFYELASLGGANNMRGFFPDRFLGKESVLINTEYRIKVSAFNFRNIWDVRIDGVLFGDMGRVFLTYDEISQDFKSKKDGVSAIFDEFRYSYGAGLRISLGEALVARLDAGFSNEQVGLVYLVFGQTF